MSRALRASLFGVVLCLSAAAPLESHEQEAPAKDRQGNAVSIVRNDATAKITFETRVDGQWQAVAIDAGKDAQISGDHIRVATTRQDGAVVSIEFPIAAGKKYRLFWNDQAHMWDVAASL